MTKVRSLWTLEEKTIIIKIDFGKRKKLVLNYTYAKCLQADRSHTSLILIRLFLRKKLEIFVW